MNLSLAATLTYRRHCQECLTGVEQAVASAIRDREVAKLSLVAGDKCDHEPPLVREAQRLSARSTPTPHPPAKTQHVVSSAASGATGGGVAAEPALPLEHVEGLDGGNAGAGSNLPNGLDPEGKRT